jgi:hypothetical protein
MVLGWSDKARSLVRLLGAGIVGLGFSAIVLDVTSAIDLLGLPAAARSAVPLDYWLISAAVLVFAPAVIWAGFAIVSRRPSRRRAVAIILGLATLLQGYIVARLVVSEIFISSLGLPWLIYAALWLVPWAIGLAYLAATRRKPEFLPRREVPRFEPSTAAYRPVASKIIDGPGWHESLIASLRETGTPATPRRRAWPFVIALIAVIVAGLSARVGVEAAVGVLDTAWRSLVWLVFGFALVFTFSLPFAALRRRWLQARSRRAEEALVRSGAKRPIFYLRSFGLDDEVGRPSVLELILNVQPGNPEQVMTRIIGGCGPVIAIGRPGEALPALGAARFYVADSLWQEKVADVAAVSQLVVWASGATPGLDWEITHLIRTIPPEKLILWAHPHLLDLDADEREVAWSAFVDGIGRQFPKPLPKPLGNIRFFAFGPDYTPISYAGRSLDGALEALLRAKRVPPYDPVAWSRRQRKSRLAWATIALVFAGALAAGGYAFWTYVRVTPPGPHDWNALADDLLHDEVTAYPYTPEHVTAELEDTVGQLNDRWLGAHWRGISPGRVPPLKLAAEHYLAVFRASDTNPAIASSFYNWQRTSMLGVSYGSFQPRPAIAYFANSPAEAKALLAAIAPVQAALRVADRDWAAIKPATAGLIYADQLRGVITARERLFDAEAAFLALLGGHPNTWSIHPWIMGERLLTITDPLVLSQAQVLSKQRDATEAALIAALNAVSPFQLPGLTGAD